VADGMDGIDGIDGVDDMRFDPPKSWVEWFEKIYKFINLKKTDLTPSEKIIKEKSATKISKRSVPLFPSKERLLLSASDLVLYAILRVLFQILFRSYLDLIQCDF
jgi:hypothetical protein